MKPGSPPTHPARGTEPAVSPPGRLWSRRGRGGGAEGSAGRGCVRPPAASAPMGSRHLTRAGPAASSEAGRLGRFNPLLLSSGSVGGEGGWAGCRFPQQRGLARFHCAAGPRWEGPWGRKGGAALPGPSLRSRGGAVDPRARAARRRWDALGVLGPALGGEGRGGPAGRAGLTVYAPTRGCRPTWQRAAGGGVREHSRAGELSLGCRGGGRSPTALLGGRSWPPAPRAHTWHFLTSLSKRPSLLSISIFGAS